MFEKLIEKIKNMKLFEVQKEVKENPFVLPKKKKLPKEKPTEKISVDTLEPIRFPKKRRKKQSET